MTACFLSTSIASYDSFTRSCSEIKLKSFWLFGFTFFPAFRFSFFSFSYLFAVGVDLLRGLLPVQEFPRKYHGDGVAKSS